MAYVFSSKDIEMELFQRYRFFFHLHRAVPCRGILAIGCLPICLIVECIFFAVRRATFSCRMKNEK